MVSSQHRYRAIALLMVGCATPAVACNAPGSHFPDLPNRSTATIADVAEVRAQVDQFVDDRHTYLACLREEIRAADEEIVALDRHESSQRVVAQVLLRRKVDVYNAAFDELSMAAEAFNDLVNGVRDRRIAARDSDSDGTFAGR